MEVSNIVDSFFVKFVLWGILIVLVYYIVGGICYLLMDFGYFEELEFGVVSVKVVFVVMVVLFLLVGVLVW